jgi:hypothetical protein
MLDFITADIVLIDGDYFEYIDNSDCNAPSELIPLYFGPKLPYSPEIPF